MFSSELSLRSKTNTGIVCHALEQERVLFGNWTQEGVQGIQRDEIDADEVQGIVRRATSTCNITLWWLCREGLSEEERMAELGRWLSLRSLATRTVEDALDVLIVACSRIVDDAYVRWLGRSADAAGIQAYQRLLLEEWKTAEHIREILQESEEYKSRCALFDCAGAERMVEKAFLDELFREPEKEAIESYSNLLISTGNFSLLLQILRDSSEYARLHRAKGLAEQTLKEVEELFAEVLKRKPDRRGASLYTREILLGHLTLEGLRRILQESGEYMDVTSFLSRSLNISEAIKWSSSICQADLSLASITTRRSEAHAHNFSMSVLRARRDFGAGRWCRREDCSDPHKPSCGHWPLELYNVIEVMVWSDLGTDHLESVVLSALQEQEKEHGVAGAGVSFRYRRRCGRIITSMYSDLFGRFPLPRELSETIHAITTDRLSFFALEEKMRNESEHMQRLQNTTDTHNKWVDTIQTMVCLFDRFQLSFPEEVESCLVEGMVYKSLQQNLIGFSCIDSETPGHLHVKEGGKTPPHCGPRSLSERLCGIGMLLCRPLPTMLVPSELLAFSEDEATNRFTYGTIFWPISPNNLFHDFQCHNIGKILSHLQNKWNSDAPLLNSITAHRSLDDPLRSQQKHVEDMRVTFPLAMYVNDRPGYFSEVVRSLKMARNVSSIRILVLSLDSVRQDMIDIAINIDFVPVRILFHPAREDLLTMAPLLAIKSHWWWLQQMLWNEIDELRSYDDNIALLEEDHVVTPDYVEMMSLLISMQKTFCPQCWGVCVRHGCASERDVDTFKICRTRSVINTGISFNRSTFNAIRLSDFEHFLDGWDWSLFHLAQTGQIPDMMLAPAISRVRNIGRRGSTVNDIVHEDLIRQLNYLDVGSSADFDETSFHIDDSASLSHTPPAWEPLYVGGIGFVSR
uniref:Alpha-1,6-mannosyl-glycoprotein 2-beta-N-acetylglucosaminyltransferase n=1 Tax=Hanusia phi TaxID=3032 RepID=A0A7S0HPS4_9CRYP